MKKLILSILISLSSIGISVGQNSDQLKQTLEQNMNLMIEALDQGNAEKAAWYYTADALMIFNGERFLGRESVMVAFEEAIENGLKFNLHQNKKLVTGEGVFEVGTAEILQNNKIYDQGFYEVQWKKEDDQWKILRWDGPSEEENTETVPVQFQKKDIFHLENGISISNNFDGARLSGVTAVNDSLIKILINPENTPINPSSWYAFKAWAPKKRDIRLKLSYTNPYFHRYYPKVSKDGINWKVVDSSQVEVIREKIFLNGISGIAPVEAVIKLTITPDTVWVAGQEVITVSKNNSWIKGVASNSFVETMKIGESVEGNDLNALKIGGSDDKKMIVLISRQHPPEVTGYMAMQSFVETICSDSEIAKNFRKEFNTYVIPMVNPDGVNNGHWRHNAGGVDLNRDWGNFDQPETSAIRDFVKQKVEASDGKIYFFADFHSTRKDLYYPIYPELEGNMPGIVPALIKNIAKEFTNYEPVVIPQHGLRIIAANHYFFHEYGAESMTYEVGDNTPREFVKAKGRVTAEKLMELLLEKSK